MPVSASRTGPHATTGSSSIFSRPRTTSGMRAVPVASALFEAPTADDIDKALSILEEKGGPAPVLPMPTIAPTVVHRSDAKPISDDDPTRVFDGSAEEFSQNDAVTGKSNVLPETGVPTATEGDGELTQRRSVDPVSGDVTGDVLFDATGAGKADKKGDLSGPAATLDAPLASLVDSGAAPAAKPAAPPPSKPAAPPASKPAAAPGKPYPACRCGSRPTGPAATESGRFRSDTRYKRARGKGLYWALAILVIGAGAVGLALYVKREREKRAAAAVAAAAAAPPLAAGQVMNPPTPPSPSAPETATGAGGAAAAPTEAAGTEAPAKTAPPKPEEAIARGQDRQDRRQGRSEAGDRQGGSTRRSPPRKVRQRRGGAASARRARRPPRPRSPPRALARRSPPATKQRAATRPRSRRPRPTEAAKPAEGDKGEATKPAEAAAPPVTVDRPTLKITSSPAGADVVIDGVPVGTTPFSSRDVSADGTHAISVKKDGYEPHERMISGSDWSRGKGGAQTLKFNVKLKRAGGEQKPAEAGEKKEAKPEVEILTPSEP